MVALVSWYDDASTKMARIVFVLNTKTQIITFITFIAILYTLDKVVTLRKLQKHQKKLEKLDVQRKYLHENLYKEVGNKYLMSK